MMVGRGAKKKGTRYFGPYSHAWAIRETVDLLLRVFPMRTCSNGVFKRSAQIGRPCLLGYIDKCAAPCVGNVSAEEHRRIVEDFCDFMGGQTRTFLRRIEKEMYAASDAMDFEKAARLRDDLGAMQRALEKQAVVLGDGTDADVIAVAEDPLEVAVQIFYVRGGRIRGQRGWVADRVEEVDVPELVEQLPAPAVRRLDRDRPRTRSRARSWCRRCPPDPRPLEELLGELRGRQGRDPGAAARRQEDAAGDGRPQRRPGAGAAQDEAGQRPHHPQPRARGDPGGARARRGAAAHRVLRRLQPPGHRGRRLDGGLRGRAAAQERVPPLRDQGRRRPERRRLDARGDHPPVPPPPRRAGPQRGPPRRRRGERPDARSTPRPVGPASSPTRPAWSSSTAARPRSRLPSAPSTSWASTTSRCAAWPSGSRRSGCPARRTR